MSAISESTFVGENAKITKPSDAGGKEFAIAARSELRFESQRGCCMRLLSGKAEMFGTELTSSRLYRLPGRSSSAVSTWHGCTVKLSGDYKEEYISTDTNALTVYFNLHVHLKKARSRAGEGKGIGPIVLVAGSTHVGKSTLCRMLVNWAARDGHEPILVDLDVGQNQIVVPGAIGALLVRRPSQPDDNGWFAEQPACVLHYGYLDPTQNFPLYEQLIDAMAMFVTYRCENNNRSLCAGVVLNTCGWVQGDQGYETLLLRACRAFSVDLVCVIDHERLYSRLAADLQHSAKVLLLPKSGGVINRTDGAQSTLRTNRIREYFYGTPSRPLYPHTFSLQVARRCEAIDGVEDAVRNDVYFLYRIGMDRVPLGCMPVGMKESDHQRLVSEYNDPVSKLADHVLAISFATGFDKVANTNVAGYLVVTDVSAADSMDKLRITVVSPQPLPLPGRILLYSKIRFVDV